MTDRFLLRRIEATDTTFDFTCGRAALDRFVKERAADNTAAGWSTTYVAIDAVEGDRIAGFVTVLPASVSHALAHPHIPGLPEQPSPVLLLARMGVPPDYRGREKGHRIGPRLVALVCREALELADRFGCVGVATDANVADEGQPSPRPSYEREGFVVLEEPRANRQTTKMLLTMAKVRERLDAGE